METALQNQLDGLVKDISELNKKLGSEFATKADVEKQAQLITQLTALQKQVERRNTAHKTFGTQENFDLVAGVIGKELIRIGKAVDGTPNYAFWSQKAAGLNSSDAGQGPEFLPVTIDSVVSKLVEDNGILRSEARIVPGVRGTLGVKTRATRATVNGQARADSAIPTGASTYDNNPLSTFQVALITTVEEKLIYESPINLVEEAIEDLAEAAAELEDDILFAGQGTAADCGFTGFKGANTGVGGNDESVTVANFGIDNALNVRTHVHTSVFGSGRYFMHPYTFANLQTKKAAGSGQYHFDPSLGMFRIGGSPIRFAPRMDSTIAATNAPIVYGDIRKAVTVGLGRDYEIRILTERYADEGQIGVRLVYDLGLKLVQPAAVAKVLLTA